MSDHAQTDVILVRHATRNFVLNVLDGTAYMFGISMVSRYTVLPLLVSQLSSERWLQGVLPALTYAGWMLPGLFTAPLVASLPRR
ncbi:MAG TPA: MFS transporter, partial [Roseiflexaceae bacterium]|nr:MFS transporter [Roseiflexaceae bacterium]